MSFEQGLAVFGVAGAVVSFIWHAGMYVGKLKNELSRHSDTLSLHGQRIDRHDTEIHDLQQDR